jgi:hypothetical protein
MSSCHLALRGWKVRRWTYSAPNTQATEEQFSNRT